MDKSQKKALKRVIYGRKFLLTVHGQNYDDYRKLQAYFETPKVTRAVIAREFGLHKIHPHWQCYFEHDNASTGPITGRKLMEEILGHKNYHIEVAKGTTESNVSYIYAVNKTHEIGFVDFNKNCTIPSRHNQKRVDFWNSFTLRPFQKQILDLLTQDTDDDRSIFWFYDEIGNTGKTKLMEYLHIFHGAIVTGGNSSDMKHAISRWKEITGHNPVFILLNVSRSDSFTKQSAKAVESIKDGLFFSGKYESGMVHARDKAVVAIFSNLKPNVNFFSLDRWKIFEISKNLQLVKKSPESFN